MLAGGVLTDLLDWRWVLFVNVPVGVALLAGAAWALSKSRVEGAARHLDVAGAVSVTAGLAVLVYGIVSTGTHPWASARTICVLALDVALLGAFVLIEARLSEHPLVALGLFRRRSLSAANGVAAALGAAPFCLFFFLSLYLQQINGYTGVEQQSNSQWRLQAVGRYRHWLFGVRISKVCWRSSGSALPAGGCLRVPSAGEGGGRDAWWRVAGLEGAGFDLYRRPVDPLDESAVEPHAELDGEPGGPMGGTLRPVDLDDGSLHLGPMTDVLGSVPAEQVQGLVDR